MLFEGKSQIFEKINTCFYHYLHKFPRTMKQFALNSIAASCLMPHKIRYLIYKQLGIQVNDVYQIKSRCFMTHGNVRFGNNSFVNHCVSFVGAELIDIGENCFVGFEAMFCTTTHEIGTCENRAGKLSAGPIKIGKGCWVGARATILPGITIGEGCVIATGAVVIRNCEPNGLYAGVPARRIKDLP